MKKAALPPRAAVEKIYGASVIRLASQFHYVADDTRIEGVAAIFESWPDIQALGVVGPTGAVRGACTRDHLYAYLGKPFGRDLLARKPVGELLEDLPAFDPHDNLFQVATNLETVLDQARQSWYLLRNREGGFRGMFSSRDLLVFLSRMTREDIDMASALQDRMVKPRQTMEGKNWQGLALSRSAKGLGGDFHFHMSIGKHLEFFALGDVSGKGVSASVITSLLWGILRIYDYHKGLKALVRDINDALIHTFHLERYLTGTFMILDTHSLVARVADMGHGHLGLVRRKHFRDLVFPRTNLPLGIDTALDTNIYRVELKKGDLLCAWTDGMAEQENAQGEEFGIDRLRRTVAVASRKPQEIPHILEAELLEWRGDVPQHDDMTWLQIAL